MKRIFLIVMVVAAVLLGPMMAIAADECQETTATNRQHVKAGRAYRVAGFMGCESRGYYALGSEDFLGEEVFARTTLFTIDDGQSYQLGNCPTGDEDIDQDGYTADEDCDDYAPDIHPGAMDFCGDGIDQDCDGADTPCILPPSCISNLNDWKVKFAPNPSNCLSCHTTCTPGGRKGMHPCIEGSDWGEMSCRQCHSTVHN